MKKELPIIKLKNVSKIYELKNKKEMFTALKEINLEIYKGESIGIIGNNGVGKTTLLKIISGIVRPTLGEVEVKGKVVTLMNLEDGFKLELNGRENIYLNGLLVGMTRAEIKKNMKKIIAYSGIGKFIDQPLYTYSAGMKFRLAFSVAIASCCDVMIIDEILTAGDFYFQQKAFKSLAKLQKERKQMITIVCSHIPDLIWGFSNKYFLVNKCSIKQLSKSKMATIIRKKHNMWNKLLNWIE